MKKNQNKKKTSSRATMMILSVVLMAVVTPKLINYNVDNKVYTIKNLRVGDHIARHLDKFPDSKYILLHHDGIITKITPNIFVAHYHKINGVFHIKETKLEEFVTNHKLIWKYVYKNNNELNDIDYILRCVHDEINMDDRYDFLFNNCEDLVNKCLHKNPQRSYQIGRLCYYSSYINFIFLLLLLIVVIFRLKSRFRILFGLVIILATLCPIYFLYENRDKNDRYEKFIKIQ